MQKAEGRSAHTTDTQSHSYIHTNIVLGHVQISSCPNIPKSWRMPLVRVRSGRGSFLPERKGGGLEFTVRINLMIRGRGVLFYFSIPQLM